MKNRTLAPEMLKLIKVEIQWEGVNEDPAEVQWDEVIEDGYPALLNLAQPLK